MKKILNVDKDARKQLAAIVFDSSSRFKTSKIQQRLTAADKFFQYYNSL
jgi:hypothetical protein